MSFSLPPVLIIGARGDLGSRLTVDFERRGYRVVKTTSDPDLGAMPGWHHFDLLCPDMAALPLGQIGAALICAGITHFQACETDPNAYKINVENTIALIEALIGQGKRCYFLSSNAVFADGDYMADDQTPRHPNTAYGRHKLIVEERFASHPLVAILRSTKVFHRHHPLLETWRHALAIGQTVTPLADAQTSPISVAYYLAAFRALYDAECGGILNISGQRNVTYSELAQCLFAAEGFDVDHLILPEHRSSDDPRPRPRKLPLLDMSGLAIALGIKPQALGGFVADCVMSHPAKVL